MWARPPRRPRKLAARLLLAAVLVLGTGLAGAAAEPAANPSGRKYPPRVYRTQRLQGRPPVIDGRLDDEAWSQGEWSGDYTQQLPTEGAAPSQPTELKILHDARSLYFAIRVHDDPAKVHRWPGRRDDFTGDVVGICFDSYNDKRTGFEFDLTAGGSKIDLILGNGETEWDTTWDAVWEGEVAHDAGGWTAEFRVPLSQLRYASGDEQVWGLHAWRWIDRNQEEDQWQLIPRQNTGRMHQLGELHGISALSRSRRLELLPHALGSVSSGPASPRSGHGSASGGLDAKVGLSSSFTLDATVNPDFGQVEADPSVVNLSAYETFYEEKRPFFLEGKKILAFGIEDDDQLFYSRRVGQAPSLTPALGDGESMRLPGSTTILSAVKVTGKTGDGLSIGVVQSLTQRETARISSPAGTRGLQVEPFGSFTVARVHQDWDKGNTSLGGMLTQTHRRIADPALAFLPADALTGGLDFSRHFANRSWVLEASGVFSRVSGAPEAIRRLELGPVHYYQRPEARHLGVGEDRTSLSGHGGSVRFGRSEKGRFRLGDHFHWYSPGLDLNEAGYLKQADVLANRVALGWHEPSPRGVLRDYSVELSREDAWDFGGLATRATTALESSAQFRNKWKAVGRLAFDQVVDTRALRGGPALRWHDYATAALEGTTDPSRRIWLTAHAERSWAVEDDSASSSLWSYLSLRPSNRLSFSARAAYERLDDSLQYVATADAGAGPRFVLGRIDQDTWSFTLRANLSLTPDLTVQYYGSPFVGTARYRAFKRAIDPLARDFESRFHPYAPGEISFQPEANAYRVDEADGAAGYSFANPDFSFREFRSNLVVRWEYRPGSSLYAVWSQGRTSAADAWQQSLTRNWDALWSARAQNVFMVKLSYWFSP